MTSLSVCKHFVLKTCGITHNLYVHHKPNFMAASYITYAVQYI